MTQPHKIVLQIGRGLLGLGLPIGVGGLIWKFSQTLGSVKGQEDQIIVIMVGFFIVIPVFMVGTLTMLVSTSVDAIAKSHDQEPFWKST